MERESPPPKKIHNQSKPAKKHRPLKVVYISNPMKITTSAAAFRAVVQELTGQNSDIGNILTRQPSFESSPPPRPAEYYNSLIPHRPPPKLVRAADAENSFEFIPERFGGSMEDYFSGNLPPSLLFDPPQLGADCAGGSGGVYGGA